jgi:hypothetical protein
MSAAPTIFGSVVPAWTVAVAVLAVWIGFLWTVTRLFLWSHERVRCPLTGRMGWVVFLRGPDGGREDIVHCSLLPTCGGQCMHAAAA